MRKTLKSRLLALSLLGLLSTMIIAGIAISHFSAELESQIIADLVNKSELIADNIDSYVKQREIELRMISKSDVFENGASAKIDKYLNEILRENNLFIDILFLDWGGYVISSRTTPTGGALVKLFPQEYKLVQETMIAKQGETLVSDAMLYKDRLRVAIYTPVTNDDNTKVIGMLRGSVNLEPMQEIIKSFNNTIAGSKYVYVADNGGRVIFSPDPSLKFLDRYPDLKIRPDLISIFQSQNGYTRYIDHAGDDVLVSYMDTKEFGQNKALDWSMVAVTPYQEMMAPVGQATRNIMLVTIVFIVIILVITFYISDKISRPVSQASAMLKDLERIISDDQFRIPKYQANFEEFDVFINSFNEMLRELKDREEALQKTMQAKIMAEEYSRAKSEFLSRMSHELRTPMNAILGFAQLLEMARLTPDMNENVQHILKAGNHLLKLINELLDLSRIESGKLELSIKSESLHKMITECLTLVKPLAEQREITLVDAISDSEDHSIEIDYTRMKQVMINLLSNAIKYNHPRGIVRPYTGSANHGRIRLNIQNTGPGMDEAQMAKLFTPFERPNPEHHAVEGAGIGLVISQRLAESMQGELGAACVAGEGCTFWVDIPMSAH